MDEPLTGEGSNTKFAYMYRDAANYKQHGNVVFVGAITPEQVTRIQANLLDGDEFDPEDVGLDSVEFGGEYDDDPPYHEAVGFTVTDWTATDGRTIDEFVEEMATVEWTDHTLEETVHEFTKGALFEQAGARLSDRDIAELRFATVYWRRDEDAEQAAGYTGPEYELHRARHVQHAAFLMLEAAVLRVVSLKVKAVYPTAAALAYDGEENEDGLLHTYVRRILDADGNVLDDIDNRSDEWDELIDQEVEPLLWEVSERDQSYYGEDKQLELVAVDLPTEAVAHA